MKKHVIIPIFISHRGCPNDCVFCNQKKITARDGDVTPEDVSKTVETWLTTLHDLAPSEIELAFFGGSFTGLPLSEQEAFLEIAKGYKEVPIFSGSPVRALTSGSPAVTLPLTTRR